MAGRNHVNDRISVRFDEEEIALYRALAEQEKVTLSEFVRFAVTRGVVVSGLTNKAVNDGGVSGHGKTVNSVQQASNRAILATFEMVAEITRQRDPEAYNEALKRADETMQELALQATAHKRKRR